MRVLLLLCFTLAVARDASATDAADCLRPAGGAGVQCLARWLRTVESCRRQQDATCEALARVDGGPLEQLTAVANAAGASCDDTTAETLGYQTRADVGVRNRDACSDWGEAFLDLAWSKQLQLSGSLRSCQHVVAKAVGQIRKNVVSAYGPGCFLREANAKTCDRDARELAVLHARNNAWRRIMRGCGEQYAALGLEPIGTLVSHSITLARHFAQLVYPPNDLGPTAELGPFLVGLRTLELFDPSRLNTKGTGPRPVTVEVYYPTTLAAVAGKAHDIATILGIPVATVPAWRDVAVRPGTYPLVAFSHGNNGTRIQSFFFGAHLASHGYIVVSPDHHGNTFPDTLSGLIDPAVATNRPLDMSFVITQMLAFNADPSSVWHDAIDPTKIGASGHSFGGFTAFALAGGDTVDTRVKAILPQAPAAPFPDSFFQSIHIPVLIIGGSIDETTPFPANQQHPFDVLPSGAPVVALAEIADAGHFTFSDFCEVDRTLLGFLGGFGEACEPRHIPFRQGHDITNYLALNFFDATLRGDAAALDRLDPAVVGGFDDLHFERK